MGQMRTRGTGEDARTLGLVEVFGLDAEELVDRFPQGGVRG